MDKDTYTIHHSYAAIHSPLLVILQVKPHIYKHGKHWVCRQNPRGGRPILERAAKPVTAYRAFQRRLKWERAGRPGGFR